MSEFAVPPPPPSQDWDDEEEMHAISHSQLLNTYQIGKELGVGAFSVVRLCCHRESGEIFAMKICDKSKLRPQDIETLHSEVRILRSIDSPYVIKCVDFLEDDIAYYVVMEYMSGGELFERIVQKTVYSEKEARDLIHTLLTAVKYCHDVDVVHRDLKPENLLLKSPDNDHDIKLADFGFAVEVKGLRGLTTQCGTPDYVAPEILKGEAYGKPVDMWSIGVITYIILGGYPPFYDDNQKMLFKKIKLGSFVFHNEYWSNVSAEAKDLISKLLVVNPDVRYTVDQALHHPWMCWDSGELASRNLDGNLKEFKRYIARRRLRAAVRAVLAVSRIKNMTLLCPAKPISNEQNVSSSTDV